MNPPQGRGSGRTTAARRARSACSCDSGADGCAATAWWAPSRSWFIPLVIVYGIFPRRSQLNLARAMPEKGRLRTKILPGKASGTSPPVKDSNPSGLSFWERSGNPAKRTLLRRLIKVFAGRTHDGGNGRRCVNKWVWWRERNG